MKRKNRFNLRRKLVLFTTILALITYSTSALFIYVFYDYITAFIPMSERVYVVTVLALGVFWSGLLAYFAAHFVTKSLMKLELAATRAAEGDLDQTIEIPKSDDEIRSLSIAFDTMLKNIRTMVHNIETHFENTNQSVMQIREASNVAAKHSTLITASANDISRGAESSAEAIQQTAEAVEEATVLAQEVQQKARQSKQKSSEMLDVLTTSQQAVNELVQGIQALATDQQQSLNDVENLKQNASQVESIVTMVGDIAEQTNLLALNASIEAARAGENGRGFAVVAEEVRLLADQSAQAVQRISGLIKAIQEDVNGVVLKISEHVDHANKEAKSGETTNVAIEQMSESVQDVAHEIDMISDLVNRQLESIQATVKQSQEVAAIAEETSAASEEVNASVQEQASTTEEVENLAQALAEQAKDLNEQIKQFSIKTS